MSLVQLGVPIRSLAVICAVAHYALHTIDSPPPKSIDTGPAYRRSPKTKGTIVIDDSSPRLPESEQLAPGGPHEATYPVSVGALALGKSERWYIEQLKTGRFPGHKAGRSWFLTTGDINAAIEATRRPAYMTPDARLAYEAALQKRRATRRRNPIPPQKDRRR